jgi:hypothetical protein
MKPKGEKCECCEGRLEDFKFYLIYRLIVATNETTYYIGIVTLIDELSDYAMKCGYHLSGSQIILLRPDIMKEFLEKKFYPQRALFWFLIEDEICHKCYNESYKSLVPVK